jgi:hypothetical protein
MPLSDAGGRSFDAGIAIAPIPFADVSALSAP